MHVVRPGSLTQATCGLTRLAVPPRRRKSNFRCDPWRGVQDWDCDLTLNSSCCGSMVRYVYTTLLKSKGSGGLVKVRRVAWFIWELVTLFEQVHSDSMKSFTFDFKSDEYGLV